MKLSLPAKKMIFVIIIATLVIMAGGAVYYRSAEALNFAFGTILLSALNVLKVYLLERTVQKVMDIGEAKSGKNYISFQYLIRYILTGAVLVAAALIPFINLWGAIIGVFTFQIAVYAVRFMKLDTDPADNVKTAETLHIEDTAAVEDTDGTKDA